MHWWKKLKARTRFKEPLCNHTTLRIGGPADVWVQPRDFEELSQIVQRCLKERMPYLVIGRGSNILFDEQGFKGVVICLDSGIFTKMAIKGSRILCSAGLPLKRLIRQTEIWGLGGLEFLAGIPASAGGALVMNAGNRQKNIGSLVKSVTAMDRQGRVRVLKDKQLKFGYRQSNLNKYIVLQAVLKLVKRSRKKIKENMAKFLEQKRRTQDLSSKSAGCIFKNPECRSSRRISSGCRRTSSLNFSIRHARSCLTAGEMIDLCGLKGRRRGGAEISTKHANYIINRNAAKAKDMLCLIKLAQREVKKRFGVNLEPEIKIIKE